MKSYHFDLGNSNTGAIGFSARVEANSKAEAVELLREYLPDELPVPCVPNDDGIEYITIYLNGANVSAKDIDEWEVIERESIRQS